MKLTNYSQARIRGTFADWEVPADFANPMYNYLVYGYQPGSFFSYVLANNFVKAILSSHPANTVEAFKALAGWINECCPKIACGNYDKVDAWCDMTWDLRRPILEKQGLIYTEKEEVWMILKSETLVEPVLF